MPNGAKQLRATVTEKQAIGSAEALKTRKQVEGASRDSITLAGLIFALAAAGKVNHLAAGQRRNRHDGKSRSPAESMVAASWPFFLAATYFPLAAWRVSLFPRHSMSK